MFIHKTNIHLFLDYFLTILSVISGYMEGLQWSAKNSDEKSPFYGLENQKLSANGKGLGSECQYVYFYP